MSYADAAASGPSQTPAESRRKSKNHEPSVRVIKGGNSESFRAPAPPEVVHKQDAHTSSIIDVDSPHVISVPSEYDGSTTTQADREARETEAKIREFERKAEKEAANLREKARKAESKALRNKDNPVVIGNTAILGIGAFALGWGAYVKYSKNELSGKLVGLWAAGLAAFAVGDFYTSQWLFKNKYPTK